MTWPHVVSLGRSSDAQFQEVLQHIGRWRHHDWYGDRDPAGDLGSSGFAAGNRHRRWRCLLRVLQRALRLGSRLAWLLTHDRSSCEDISHEAFALVLPRFASLDDPAAYLRRVIINRVAERNRRSSRERLRIDFITAGQPLVEDGPTGGLIDAISVLPMNQRTAVVLRYWVDLNHIQIADAMGIRPGTVRSLLSRATATLRKDITS